MVQAAASSGPEILTDLELLKRRARRRADLRQVLRRIHVTPDGCWVWRMAPGDTLSQAGQARLGQHTVFRLILNAIGRAGYNGRWMRTCNEPLCVAPAHRRRRYDVDARTFAAADMAIWTGITRALGVSFPAPSGRAMTIAERIAVYCALKLLRPKLSYPDIGQLCGRHHATLMYLERQFDARPAVTAASVRTVYAYLAAQEAPAWRPLTGMIGVVEQQTATA